MVGDLHPLSLATDFHVLYHAKSHLEGQGEIIHQIHEIKESTKQRAAICFGIFFPFFFGIFSRFLGLDGFHCVLQASSLICIVLLHVGPQKVVVSQAMLHAKTQHLPPKQNDNTYCHQQGYRQKHLYISVSIYIYI